MTYLTDIERLNYYEGEFLGAVDFQAEQEYHRDMRRRHNLGQHTWGIVTGLDLAQAPNGVMDGTLTEVDVYLQPGMAVDGFGREIVVLNQYQLSPSLFAAFAPQTQGSQNVQTLQVWIGFQQALLQPPTDSCTTMNVSNAYARIQETYTLTVTQQGVLPANSALVVNGTQVTSSTIGTTTDPPPITLPADDSIPYQEFSTDDTNLTWWLCLGQVSWDASNSVFVQLSSSSAATAGREYVGNVSAETYAPAAAYLIADRNSPYPPTASSTDPNLGGVQAEVAGSLTVDFLLNAELAVLIGAAYNSNSKITRPLTIVASGKNQDLLELRNSAGTPAWYVNEQFDGTTLGLNLGEVGLNGNVDNRIFVQPTLTNSAPSQQNVGIGTSTPRNPLAIRGQGAWWELLSFEDNKGLTKWHMNHNPQGSAPNGTAYTPGLNFCETGQANFRLFLQSGGNVGIGTGAPVASLDIGSGVLHVGGATNPSITNQGAYLGWNALTGGTGESDFINQQGLGTGGFAFMNVTTSGGGLNTLMFINGKGQVGIGTISPDRPLAIQAQGTGQELISFKNLGGATKWHMNQNLSGTANGLNFAETGVADGRLFLQAGGNVGIGTTSPLAPLHVASPSGLSNSALPNVLIESPSGLGPSPRLGLVDTSLGSNTSAPVWFIDNDGDTFRIFRQPNYSTGGTTFLEIDNSGNVTITQGGLNISNGTLYSSFKSGCVQDRFINRDGLNLQRGDVVVLHSTPAAHYFGPDSRIPLIEVQLTDSAMDTRVCGIVDEPSLPDKELGDLDRTKLGNAKVGRMVTLGAYAFCKVDANISPISPGDLLTTSPTPGYAQKLEADLDILPGGIIGKALGSMRSGKGMIPVLVSHQ